MTPEQWQQEFRKELDRLREPIDLIYLDSPLYSNKTYEALSAAM